MRRFVIALCALLLAPVAFAQNAMNWRETFVNGLPRYTLENDASQTTESPLFAVDGRYSRPKVVQRSTIWSDPGDTVDLAAQIANGTPASPTFRTAPYPGFYLYGWPLDTSGNYQASQSPYSATAYLGRNAQISMWLMETPTQTARGGALVFGTTPLGYRTPFDRMWIRPNGWAVFTGRAFEDSGISYPYNPNALNIQAHHSPMTGMNPYDYAGYGTITALAPDQSQGAALALMAASSPATGVRWNFNNSTGRVAYVAQVGAAQRAVFTADLSDGSLHVNRASYNEAGWTPPLITGDVTTHYLHPEASVLRLVSNAARLVRGLDASGDGREIVILNMGAYALTLTAQDAAASAGNRFGFSANVTLQPGDGINLIYSTYDNRWHRVM